MDNTFVRRTISISSVVVALPVLLVLAPAALVLLAALDLVTGQRRLPSPRLYLFLIVFLVHDWIVIPLAGWLWIRGGAGRTLDRQRHSDLQGWWVASLMRWARRLLSIDIAWPDDDMPDGVVIILSRHASMIDAVLPALLFTHRLDRPVHYVMKKELRWLPTIDIYGHRLGNHFVDRTGDSTTEVTEINELAGEAEPDSGLVIFPEGTYATPATRARVRASLERRGNDDLVAFADELSALLPPKPAGTLALLDAQADADIVVFGHVGMEGVAELRGLRTRLPATRPIEVAWWSFARTSVPDDADGRVRWLNEQWRSLDRWVADHLA